MGETVLVILCSILTFFLIAPFFLLLNIKQQVIDLTARLTYIECDMDELLEDDDENSDMDSDDDLRSAGH